MYSYRFSFIIVVLFSLRGVEIFNTFSFGFGSSRRERIARLVTNGSTAAHSLLGVLRLNSPRSLAKEEET